MNAIPNWILVIAVIAVLLTLFFLTMKYIGRPVSRYFYRKQMERQAEIEMLTEINWQRAQKAAANKVLRRNGYTP